jgi:pimeloyl-ACP methyl ester carboxylesterase
MPRFFTLLLTTLGLALTALPARAQSPIAGRWEGAIDVLGTSLQMIVVFTGDGPALKATIDIPQQNAKGLPLSAVRFDAPKVHFELPAGPGLATFDGELAGDRITGAFAQAGIKGTFELTRAAAVQAPAEPVPYKEEEVRIQSPGATLAGTLTLPASGGPFPAVVMITGSGAQNRDEELFGFKPFRVIADHLTRKGIAVLRCDDRGVGGSTGDTGQATSSDFAGDVLAQVQYLKARAEIDKAHIGVLGHSEGGLVGPLAAARSSDIAFVIMMSGPALTGEKIMLAQAELLGRAAGRTDEQIARNAALQRQLFAAARTGTGWAEAEAAVKAEVDRTVKEIPESQRAAMGDVDKLVAAQVAAQMRMVRTPWFKFFLDYDPLPALEKLTCPLLAVFGELDLQVPAEADRTALEQALARSGHKDHVVRVMPKANHLYQEAKTGSVAEYATLNKEFVPGLLDLFSSWILQHARGGR